jgi:hypothetical protein
VSAGGVLLVGGGGPSVATGVGVGGWVSESVPAVAGGGGGCGVAGLYH